MRTVLWIVIVAAALMILTYLLGYVFEGFRAQGIRMVVFDEPKVSEHPDYIPMGTCGETDNLNGWPFIVSYSTGDSECDSSRTLVLYPIGILLDIFISVVIAMGSYFGIKFLRRNQL